MKTRQRLTGLLAILTITMLLLAGCAVARDQQTVGSYVDDSAITTAVKARFAQSREVAASSISVETLNGVVLLSGFAKDADEKQAAESIAGRVNGVQSVRNNIEISE